ncbi:hypothetical protein AVEN_261703-1 [Araneus ventricosus]|uniref:Uncharacterized protein n=1 Tax=Araneus ventricosus TaxID=182803 RepID=A0A4Y2DUZ8_ARAVE|nr:hypothetical protein AVEN_261703-1 [Araneus ventricosus]
MSLANQPSCQILSKALATSRKCFGLRRAVWSESVFSEFPHHNSARIPRDRLQRARSHIFGESSIESGLELSSFEFRSRGSDRKPSLGSFL